MKRSALAVVLTAALGGCATVDRGPGMSGPVCPGNCGPVGGPPPIPGLQGPYGQGVPVAAPYTPPMNAKIARYMMSQSVPLNMAQMGNRPGDSGIVQASANIPPGGMPGMPVPPGGLMAPPGMPMNPGMMPPGMPGGPGRMPPGKGPMPPGAQMMAAAGPLPPPGALPLGPPHRFAVARTQVRFVRPSGMKIAWATRGPDGKSNGASPPIEAPGRYNFLQGAVYRLKLSAIEGRPGLELYPTLEVVPANPKTEAFLAHNAVPVDFSEEDFRQVVENNYLIKVIYLPSPEYQEFAVNGLGEIVSTKLEPGADPIKEALRRGSILLVVRMGNMDQEAPNTPPIDAPGPQGPPPGLPPGIPPGLPPFAPGMAPAMPHGPGPMMPYTGMPPMMAPGPRGPMGPMGPMGGPMPPMGQMPPMGPNGPMGPMPYQLPTGMPGGPQGMYPTGMPQMPMGMPGMGLPPGAMPQGGMPLPPGAMPMPQGGGMPMPPGAAPAAPGGWMPPAPTQQRSELPKPPASAAPSPSVSLPLPPTAAALAAQDPGTGKR